MPTYKCGVFKDKCQHAENSYVVGNGNPVWPTLTNPPHSMIPCGGCPVNESVVRASLIKVEEPPRKESIECELTKECGKLEAPYWRESDGYSTFSMPTPTKRPNKMANLFVGFSGKRVRITVEELQD